MADQIELNGLRAVGAHGVLPEEHARAQPFEVDLIIEADLSAAGASDNLADTIDYGAASQAVIDLIEGEHHDLIESLAASIASKVLSFDRVDAVVVTLRKLRPPVPVQLESSAVRIRRTR